MNKSLKSERGAITLVVLVTMLFLIAFLMTMFLKVANKAQTSAETTEQIKQKYNNLGDTEIIYQSYFSDENIIPIYTVEQLKKIGSGEQVEINGKIYTFATNGYYVLETDLDLGGTYDEETDTWSGEWESITNEFTGVLDGIGHEITGLYINNSNDNQGLFGELNGTVKNLNISKGYIKANNYVGAIAGKNNGTIKNCYNQVTIEGKSYIGGIAGNLNEGITDCYNTGLIIGENNVTGGYFKSITTGEILNNVWSDDILSENAYFVSGEATATAPKGFKVSKNVFEQTIKDGMVIQDSASNEFVWIPVEDGKLDRTEWEDNKPTETINENYTETLPEDIVASVAKYKGFYIGRYEAGSTTKRTSSSGTTTMVVQKGAYPYNYVTWNSAVTLSQGRYSDSAEYGVTSVLPYGAMWDETLRFVKDDNHNVTNSTSWGNYKNNTFTFSGIYYTGGTWLEEVTNETKPTSKNWLLTTGASETNKAKNIYDLAGSVWEWTMEARSEGNRVSRGGSYGCEGSGDPASKRYYSGQDSCAEVIGFRPVLYIK